MSRIGKQPVTVPSGVDVAIDGQVVTVKGPKGTLSHTVAEPIKATKDDDGTVAVARPNDERQNRSLHGLTRTLINNMVIGVSQGFERKLELVGVGYRAAMQGADLNLSLGFSHPVLFAAPAGITLSTPTQTEILVQGADKQAVGEAAAKIRGYRPPEPYKGKGVKYAGEVIIRKEAKKA